MTQPALHIEKLFVNYGSTPVLSCVCLDVLDKEFLGIIGPNGGGKTTLLKTILGLVPIEKGTISIYGESISKGRGSIGYVPQFSPVDRKFPVSVREVVLSAMLEGGLHPLHRYNNEQKTKALEHLNTVGMEHLADRQISQLSGGEFQRMLIARALAASPRLLLLDEPTANVDPGFRDQFYDLLGALNENITIVMVTHDMLAISTKVKRLACINRGVVYHGAPELTENVVQQMYGCPVDLIAHGVPHRVLGAHGEGCDHC